MLRQRLGAAVGLLGLAAPPNAHACLWDRDTLRAEAAGLPGVVEIIVGRFDVWPAGVYESRLERVAAELARDPSRLDLYDDAGVACDKLGRHDESVEWMARKRARLDALATPDDDHEYRYHANLGTFHVHRWIAAGADRTDMADVHAARDHITKAIEINPDAHFGREPVQLRVIEWLIAAPGDDGVVRGIFENNHPYLRSRDLTYWDGEPADPGEVIEGLAGMITLGAAWNSLDIHIALGRALEARQDASIAYLERRRCAELHDAGSRSLNPAYDDQLLRDEYRHALGGHARDDRRLDEYYDAARRAAQRRQGAREAYILAALARGEHPDDAPDFWAGWTEPDAPELPTRLLAADTWAMVGLSVVVVVAAAAACGAIVCVRRLRRPLGPVDGVPHDEAAS